jgi:hypothetical protein
MCGNSIGQDRRFMVRYMPQLEAWFHYRNLDVSTLKELCRRWKPDLAKGFVKKSEHTALTDIRESIERVEVLPRALHQAVIGQLQESCFGFCRRNWRSPPSPAISRACAGKGKFLAVTAVARTATFPDLRQPPAAIFAARSRGSPWMTASGSFAGR